MIHTGSQLFIRFTWFVQVTLKNSFLLFADCGDYIIQREMSRMYSLIALMVSCKIEHVQWLKTPLLNNGVTSTKPGVAKHSIAASCLADRGRFLVCSKIYLLPR
jgi:hypothetical protein